MKIDYKFGHSTIDGFLTEYADKKFTHVLRLAPANATLEIEFSEARGNKGHDAQVDLILTSPGQHEPIYITVTAENYQTSIDLAKEKLDTMIRKLKEKIDKKIALKDLE